MATSAYVDTFARNNLPPPQALPEFIFEGPDLQLPARLNVAAELLDRWIEQGQGGRIALIGERDGKPFSWTYAELHERACRIAGVLVERMGMVSGNRVLLRGANTPMFAACWLGVMKAGGIAVGSMPLLRERELKAIIDKAQITHALCDARIAEALEAVRPQCPQLRELLLFNGDEGAGSLEAEMAQQPPVFASVDTAADDTALIAFTSGTTGEPKGTMHFHRDMLVVGDTYGRYVLRAAAEDRFISTAPIAFTFGLGGIALFPMRIGAASILIEKTTPADLMTAIAQFKATVCFTAPTAYRAMLPLLAEHDLSSVRKCVSAGETLSKATYEAWRDATGIKIMDGIGATEMLHIFIGSPEDSSRPGSTGRPVPGYEARIVDEEGREVPPGTIGRLAVRGPTGCRYLADPRQQRYVQNGWNVTGDAYLMDAYSYFWFQARSDDMIVSAGYNIAGPEVEAALLSHPAVAECGVVGAPDEERGQIVTAYVVLQPGAAKSRLARTGGEAVLTKELQDHVKATIAPYKYPRRIIFVDELPKTLTGKLQRFALRRLAVGM